MRRRGVLRAFVAGTVLVASGRGWPQPSMRRVGFLIPQLTPDAVEQSPNFRAAMDGIAEAGYRRGRNLEVLWRAADGRYERLPSLARELVSARVDAILAGTPPSVSAAMAATPTIPVVFVAAGDPVELGYVKTFARPGGNVTGVSNSIDGASTKYIEFLRLVSPKLARVASLANPVNPNHRIVLERIRSTGLAMGVEIISVEARDDAQLESAFTAIRGAGIGAVVVQADGYLATRAPRIAEFATRAKLPSIAWHSGLAHAGILMSYGSDILDDFRRAGAMVGRILGGARPENIPVEQPTAVPLVVNLRTARSIGVDVPPELLVRAHEVVQ